MFSRQTSTALDSAARRAALTLDGAVPGSSSSSRLRTFASTSTASQPAPASRPSPSAARPSSGSSTAGRARPAFRRGPPGASGERSSTRSGPGGAAASGGRAGRGGGGGRRDRPTRGPTFIVPFEQWIKGPIAARYKETPTSKGPHWIGETPFPLNNAFRPPAPLHQVVKDELWRLHASDPAKYTVRALSSQFSISITRVEAILRLKALEAEYTAHGVPLQSDFQTKMDLLLGSEIKPTLNPEQPPVGQRKDHSPRGQMWEECAETDPEGESVLGPALAKLQARRAGAVAQLAQRGVDPSVPTSARTLSASSSSSLTGGPKSKKGTASAARGPKATLSLRPDVMVPQEAPRAPGQRAVLTVVNVGGRSYVGDSRIWRNQKRAEKRGKIKAKQRAAARAAGGAVAAGAGSGSAAAATATA